MHELSIVMGIIGIAEKQAVIAHASVVEEIELDIGTLAGIDMDSLDFAWTQAVKNTVLHGAEKKINMITARAQCLNCDTEFEIQNYYDACPLCNSHLLNIKQGKELRVKSLLVS